MGITGYKKWAHFNVYQNGFDKNVLKEGLAQNYNQEVPDLITQSTLPVHISYCYSFVQ